MFLALGGSVLSGVLMALGLPPYSWHGVGFVALVPYFACVHRVSGLMLFLLGLLHGVVVGGITMAGFKAIDLVPFLMYGVVVGLMGLAGQWIGISASLSAVVWIGALGVLLEWAVGRLFIPFHVAFVVWRDASFLQLSALTGVWGLSFLLWAYWYALGTAVAQRRVTPTLKGLTALLIAIHLLGALSIEVSARTDRMLTVAVVQSHDFGESILKALQQSGAQIAVFPELSLLPEEAKDIARRSGIPIIFGYRDSPYNASAIAYPDGHLSQPYYKMHPYLGEPSKPGKEAHAIKTPLGAVGIAICYDTLFTDTLRQLAQQGVILVAVPTLDPEGPNWIYHHLHGAVHPIRSAEHRVVIARSEYGAISMIVDRVGRLVALAPAGKETVLTAQVFVAPAGTLYTLLGDYWVYGCGLIGLWGVGRKCFIRR